MRLARGVDESNLAAVRGLDIEPSYLRAVVERLGKIGSSPLGFRTTGTPEDAEVAGFVSEEMMRLGLSDVAVEPVTVDGWRFRDARVVVGATSYEASSFGGVTPTSPDGVSGRVIHVGDGRRQRLDRLELAGAVVLLDWARAAVSPYAVAFELQRRGVVAMIVSCPVPGPWYQSGGALGAFDAHWPSAGPPMVFVRAEDAVAIRAAARAGGDANVVLDAEISLRTQGHNVVGYLPGRRPGPIVVGAHHDGWFTGAFDNASGVAATLGVAGALARAELQLPYTVCFSTRTGEEYGLADSSYDWCIGAWEQIHTTHPDWAEGSPFHLCVEATGRPGVRAIIETTVELEAWCRRVCRAADREGWLAHGWRVAPPVSGTELWPFLVSGVPSVAAYAWETSFGRTDYHTQLDTIDGLDFAHLAAQARLYALLVLEASRDPDGIIDHRARARNLSRVARAMDTPDPDLVHAAEHHANARGRAAFTAIGSGLVALDADTSHCYPHEQSQRDLRRLTTAIAALERDDIGAAARAVAAVGSHGLAPYLSQDAFRAVLERDSPAATARSWAANSHLTVSPDLYVELASLRGEPGSRQYGPWVAESLARAAASCADEVARRVTAMTSVLRSHPHDHPARNA
jgi:hypothetical protein